MRRLLWILLAALTIALLILVLQQNEVALDELAHFESASLEAKITAAILIGLVALMLFRQRFSHILESVLIWTAVVLLLLLGYTYRFELRDVADRVLAEYAGHPNALEANRLVATARRRFVAAGLTE